MTGPVWSCPEAELAAPAAGLLKVTNNRVAHLSASRHVTAGCPQSSPFYAGGKGKTKIPGRSFGVGQGPTWPVRRSGKREPVRSPPPVSRSPLARMRLNAPEPPVIRALPL